MSAVQGTTSPSHMKNFIKKMHDKLVQEEEQINQLCRLYNTYENCQPPYIKHGQLVLQRMHALQQSLKKDLQHSLVKSDWSDVNSIFIDTFNLEDSTFDLNGTLIQHVLQKEFHTIAQCTYYLRQTTLEAIDLSILAVTGQNAACKKLQTWQQNFTKLTNTINEQWQVTSNRDITKFISRFATEMLVAHQAFRALHELFFVVRTNTARLVRKTEQVAKSVPQATEPKGKMAVNEVTVHKQPVSKQTRKTTKKIAGKISNQELIRTFNITKYDSSIENLKKLEMAVEKLKDVKGALGTNRPLRNTLSLGKKTVTRES